jgi:hypothetical protein
LDSVDYSNGSPDGYGFIGDIQIAPDQKMYVSRYKQTPPPVNNTFWTLDSLDVIHNPNGLGNACNFQRDGVYLNHKPTEHGLPNFISNFTSPTIPSNNCSVGILESDKEYLKFQLYPNPTPSNSPLTFTYPSIPIAIGTKKEIIIHSIHGKEIARYELPSWSTSQTVKLPQMAAGVYVARLISGFEFSISNVKFVVE